MQLGGKPGPRRWLCGRRLQKPEPRKLFGARQRNRRMRGQQSGGDVVSGRDERAVSEDIHLIVTGNPVSEVNNFVEEEKSVTGLILQ